MIKIQDIRKLLDKAEHHESRFYSRHVKKECTELRKLLMEIKKLCTRARADCMTYKKQLPKGTRGRKPKVPVQPGPFKEVTDEKEETKQAVQSLAEALAEVKL